MQIIHEYSCHIQHIMENDVFKKISFTQQNITLAPQLLPEESFSPEYSIGNLHSFYLNISAHLYLNIYMCIPL